MVSYFSELKTYEIKIKDLIETRTIKTEKNIIGLWIWSLKENKQTVISIDEENLHILNTEIALIREVE